MVKFTLITLLPAAYCPYWQKTKFNCISRFGARRNFDCPTAQCQGLWLGSSARGWQSVESTTALCTLSRSTSSLLVYWLSARSGWCCITFCHNSRPVGAKNRSKDSPLICYCDKVSGKGWNSIASDSCLQPSPSPLRHKLWGKSSGRNLDNCWQKTVNMTGRTKGKLRIPKSCAFKFPLKLKEQKLPLVSSWFYFPKLFNQIIFIKKKTQRDQQPPKEVAPSWSHVDLNSNIYKMIRENLFVYGRRNFSGCQVSQLPPQYIISPVPIPMNIL